MDSPYREQAVDRSLARWVECSWCVENREPIRAYPVRPDGGLDILYSRDEGLRVVGTMTAELRIDLPPGARTVGIRFRPGMAGALLEAAPGELTDRILDAESLWGRKAREMTRPLDEARSSGECIGILLEGLRRPGEPNTVQRAIEAIAQAHGTVDLDWVACQANLSARQFRRRCLDEAGLTPKHLCRVLRFRHACALAAGAEQPEWAGIAADSGYFDQAHLIRDFREFTGATPMSVFSNPREWQFSTMST